MMRQTALIPVYDLTQCGSAQECNELAAAASTAGWLRLALPAGVCPAPQPEGPAHNAVAQSFAGGLAVSLLHAPSGSNSMNWGTRELAVEADALSAVITEAVAWGVKLVTVSPGAARPDDSCTEPAGYVHALRGTLDVMRRTVPLLEQVGVTVGLEVADHGFLLSPAECRDLIDRINSPYVGASLSGERVAAIGWVVDWVRVLGRRVVSVASRIDRLGALDDEVRRALVDVCFDGPVLFSGNPAQAMREARHWTTAIDAPEAR